MHTRGIKVWSLRLLFGLLVLLVLAALAVWLYLRASLARLDGEVKAPGLSAPVTVARDAHGVPLISGQRRADVAYATGFVHAQERFFQMDLLRRVGAGELSELFGARALPRDRANRLHRFRARVAASLKLLNPADRLLLDRYVAGVNAGLDSLSANPFEYALIGVKPRPWTVDDSLLVVCAMYFDLQGTVEPRELTRGWIRDHSDAAQLAFLLPEASKWDAPLDAAGVAFEAAPIPPAPPAWWGKPRKDDAPRLASADFIDSVGSNNWAVAGSRSKDGAAIVSDDMHLGLSLPNTWYRLAIQYPDASGAPRRIAGVTLPGAPPVIIAGSNGRVAWGYTNSYADLLDLVMLGQDAQRPGEVRTPAGWEKPVAVVETILVKGAPAEQMTVSESSLGPLRETGGKPYAIHWLAHAPASLNLNPIRLETVDTLDEALAVAATIGIPSQNFVGGDDKGNIGWTISGALPRRSQPGSGATFPLALDGGQASFDGALAPSDYPRVVNPPGGQLSTANARQLNGAGAQILGDGGFDIGARNRQIRDALAALGAATDVAGVYGVALDDRALFVAPWRERAIKVLDAQALKGRPQRAQFLDLLNKRWSGRASVDSSGYRLARHFMWALGDVLFGGVNGELAQLHPKSTMALATSRWPEVVARLLDEQPAAWLPPGHATWQSVQLAAIDRVIAELAADGLPLDKATWGERNTAAISHPIAAAVPALARWLSAPPDMLPGDANMPRVSGKNFGQSQRLTVSPGKEEQGVFNMPGGQSGHPLSPYFLDGHAQWVAGTPTPLLPGVARHTLTFK
ncbi:penicillin acylase family protein [Massilia violaceinigra]|uniref:Penicillin acylase family protein n=1 Tax=Massilia violaceinigra TaxID=2045208 RepID=A0ABY3ZZV9_9BURK|nr:penicillin acylase family protein [Massilia violaceinigra]UOD28025.1 penicillin acylase family protein [Massilia violaceinigra]